MTQVSIPSEVIWSYAASGGVLALGLVVLLRRGGWREAHGLEKLILLGPLFYAAPLSAFGIEHFTRTQAIASLVQRISRGTSSGRTSSGLALSRPRSAS
jgi:hypothetical protein